MTSGNVKPKTQWFCVQISHASTQHCLTKRSASCFFDEREDAKKAHSGIDKHFCKLLMLQKLNICTQRQEGKLSTKQKQPIVFNNGLLLYQIKLSYLTTPPLVLAVVGLTKLNFPCASSAIKIIPCETMPLISLGAKLANKLTC